MSDERSRGGAPPRGNMSPELPFRELYAALHSKLRLIFALVFGGAVLGVLLTFLITPRYDSTIAMMAKDDQASELSNLVGGLSGLVGAAGLGLQNQSRQREALAILQSRSFTQLFFTKVNALPVLFWKKWDAQNKKWLTDDGLPPTANEAYERFDRHVRTVTTSSETGLIELTIRLTDRRLAAQWANEMASLLNLEMRHRMAEEAGKSLKFLHRELDTTSELGIREAIFALIESQTKEIMLANVREEYGLRIIDPAVVSDEDDVVYPNKAILGALGALAGLLLGMIITIMRHPKAG